MRWAVRDSSYKKTLLWADPGCFLSRGIPKQLHSSAVLEFVAFNIVCPYVDPGHLSNFRQHIGHLSLLHDGTDALLNSNSNS